MERCIEHFAPFYQSPISKNHMNHIKHICLLRPIKAELRNENRKVSIGGNMYMLFSMCFEAINPTIANTITELFLLSVQNMLQEKSNSRC